MLRDEKKKTKKPPLISKAQKRDIAMSILRPFMSETRIKCYLRGGWQRVRNWGSDDIIFAITLRTISRKAYNLLRKKKILPLPCETVLKEAFAHFQLKEGTV